MKALLEPLVSKVLAHHSHVDVEELERAFDIAEKAHDGQSRKSGEPYITHPIAVAEILADIGLDQATIIAAILHDTVEDTNYSLEQLRKDFGVEVAALVDGVTKLDKLS
ncbi:MAG: HD domain-containing protein, partial [Actinobacteria bacterium]|nr:HD domain-containing protein [Actinomycetota bacterium]